MDDDLVGGEPRLPDSYKLSPHLTVGEVRCKCGTCGFGTHEGDLKQEIINLFEGIRHAAGDHPIKVTSAARCVEHQINIRRMRGQTITPALARGSAHVRGLALDLKPPRGWTLECFYQLCCAHVKHGGCGFYGPEAGEFVHVDCMHEPNYYRRWREA